MTDPDDMYDHLGPAPIALFRAMVGQRLVKAEYKTASEVFLGPEQGDPGAVHEVDHAVLLSTASMTMVLEWRIRNYDELLSIADSPNKGVSAAVTDVVDVTDLQQWNSLIGSVIVGFGMATRKSEEGHVLPWAIRISVESGSSAVVGLGEIEAEGLSYQPDNLVVIFDPQIARSYRVVGASESAWGRDLKLSRGV